VAGLDPATPQSLHKVDYTDRLTDEASMLIRTAQLLALAFALLLLPAYAGDKVASDDATGTWTLIIPEAFAGIVYSWRINADGTYQEEGWDKETGNAVQTTLSGRWSADGKKMKLAQDGIPYVFEGTRTGSSLTGTLYRSGKNISRFCALKGDTPPDRCDQSVASR
jgi:hypothetical protein